MSHGRHSKPHSQGGGVATFLALAVAGGAVALAGTQPDSRVLRYCVVGLAVVGSFQLALMARNQRASSRAMARTEDRLRTLEQRNRDEGDELHRRVLAGVAREGELRRSVESLVEEIALLRASLAASVPVPVPVSPAAEVQAAAQAAPADAATTVDIPLIQRVLAAQQESPAASPEPDRVAPLAPAAAFGVTPAAPVEDAPWPVPIAPARPAPAPGELWRAPSRPEQVAAAPVDSPGTSWVVREIQLGQDQGAALSMRILDLTTPAPSESDEPAPGEDDPVSTWTRFARPA
jgi:hypothetical protein